MTVANRLQQTLIQTKNVSVQLEQFALDTEHRPSQQLYKLLARRSADVASVLQTRLKSLQQEEEEYKT